MIMRKMVKYIWLASLLAGGMLLAQDAAGEGNASEDVALRVKIDTSSARTTLFTFIYAMDDFRRGVESDDKLLKARIDDALETFDPVGQPDAERAREAAMLLKEVLDRIPIELPEDADMPRFWRINNSPIMIRGMESGPRAGEYLFTASTIQKAQSLYARYQHLPYQEGREGAAYTQFMEDQKARQASLPIATVSTSSPRETMRTFLKAMNDYVKGIEAKDDQLKSRIDDAVSCLSTEHIPLLTRRDDGREAAILLKEVMDRFQKISYDTIPNTNDITRWDLQNTPITIIKVTEGERAGEFLFSRETVDNAKSYYEQAKSKPYVENFKGAYYKAPLIERYIPDWARSKTFGIGNWQWIGLFVALLLGLVMRTISSHLLTVVQKLAAKSKNDWDDKLVDAADRPVALIVASIFWYFCIHLLQFDGNAQRALTILVQVVFSVAIIWLLYKLADVLTQYLTSVTAKTESTLDDHLVPLLQKALRIFIIIFGILVTLQNLGYNILTLLAGLGLGGLAFALAAQDTCANLFGSLKIILDRPFQIGDWVIIDGNEGSVEEIGFLSTRIRTFYNSQISVPNAKLANADVDNMGRREFRRIKAFLGLTYDTPPEKMEAFIEGVKNIVKANPYTRKDYFHVVFSGYGDFSLNIMLYCFLKVPDWATELVERQNIYLEILRLADTLGVDFAFPTQTLHVENFPEKKTLRPPQLVDVPTLKTSAADYGPGGKLAKPDGLGIFIPPYKEE